MYDGALELNEGLAQHVVQKGDIGRNPFGENGGKQLRQRFREFRKEIDYQLHETCDLHPHEPPVSKAQCFVAGLITLAIVDHERWAVTTLLNRWLGRVPLDVTMRDASEANPFTNLTDAEVLVRLDALRTQLAKPQIIDAQPLAEVPNGDQQG